jgi:hypothetical protein
MSTARLPLSHQVGSDTLEESRQLLSQLVLSIGNLTDARILAVSQHLDRLILSYYRCPPPD